MVADASRAFSTMVRKIPLHAVRQKEHWILLLRTTPFCLTVRPFEGVMEHVLV